MRPAHLPETAQALSTLWANLGQSWSDVYCPEELGGDLAEHQQ